MKHLFFDIECANCDEGRGKICSFGYVLCDEEFNILDSRDIIINPDAPFHLTNRRDKRDIVLSYSEETFLNAPKFPHYAKEIYELLSDKDSCVWGYAVVNDVNFLISESQRYNLYLPDFCYFDAQLLLSDYKSVKDVMSLERAVLELGISVQEEHNSLEDAMNTMYVVKNICKNLGLSLKNVVRLSPRVKGAVVGGARVQTDGTPKKKVYLDIKEEIYNLPIEYGEESEAVVRENRQKAFNVYNAKKRLLHNYDSGVKASATIGELLGDIFKEEE
ncbi:MAG: hypothetical protein IJF76_05235 [Clostridia bacterium]|nr:hypothetical protein [Clostridia bacterium]